MKEPFLTLLIGIIVSVNLDGFAQCDNCEAIRAYNADFCYTDSLFEGYCAQFQAEQKEFQLQIGKKARMLPVVEPEDLPALVELSKQKSLKLTGTDILFSVQALKEWKTAERDIGMEFSETGLGLKILQEGEGVLPEKGQTVEVHYTGFLEDGRQFDSSIDRGKSFTFPVGAGRVIKGWDEAVSKLKVGTKALVKIPPELGYGSRGAGRMIPPNAILYFEIELLGIE
jgi:FKBP-type peptidyl-prolyl cis-trans isomerase